jgi:Malectin domain
MHLPHESATHAASLEEIRQALRSVLESKTFRQAPSLARLLQYLCTKALLADPQDVTEYTIAVDVFGKALDFKESKDSTVRVEVHRLRRRLTQFYNREGAGGRVRIVIAPGKYFPEFQVSEPVLNGAQPLSNDGADGTELTAPEEAPVAIEPDGVDLPPGADEIRPGPDSDEEPPEKPSPTSRGSRLILHGRRRIWLAASVAAMLAVGALGVGIWRSVKRGAMTDDQPQRWSRSAGRSSGSAGPATVPVRIMSGYSGTPHTDPSGFVWGEDRYFDGGRSWQPPTRGVYIARTNDPTLFRQGRTGEFAYHIPLPPGIYELHLYFVEARLSLEPGGGENLGTFSLDINGKREFPFLDVDSNAMGPNIADEVVLKDVQPMGDGKLHLSFQSVKGVPFVSGIEILPGLPHKQRPLRMVAQERPFVDHLGQLWRPDNYYINGRALRRDATVADTRDHGLFAGERYGHFNYALPVDARSTYTLKLYFAETYFGPQMAGWGGVGSRVFNVICNGMLLLDHFDVFSEAGSQRALVRTFRHLKPSAQGKLVLTFEPVMNYALISAIEVLDES